MPFPVAVMPLPAQALISPNPMAYLRQVAHEVVDASMVLPGSSVRGGGENTTGFTVRVPGGTQSFYPAFWVRDAAMMTGANLVPRQEIEGWIKVVAATQPGKDGLRFPHGLWIPPFSVPDHITLRGEACWFPGAYAEQGVGDYGFLPPADDAFYFVQMVHEQYRISDKTDFLKQSLKTKWGDQPVYRIAAKAFDSVSSAPDTGLVTCSGEPGFTRVDWGFCDSIRKSGSCLMPSLLRFQAARRLAAIFDSLGQSNEADKYRTISNLIRGSLVPTFLKKISDQESMLISATDVGQKDDVWASAFAVFLGVLPKTVEQNVSRHLSALYKSGGTVAMGQVRQMPPSGKYGGHWEKASSSPETYQNGGYWATPTGWMIVAIGKTDRANANKLLSEYANFVRNRRDMGAPYEWINPKTNSYVNGNYGSSAGLVYSALKEAGWK